MIPTFGKPERKMSDQLGAATLGAGCFWCVEAVFQDLRGVERVVSGYAGGSVKNPTYQQVCSGSTGHAEVAQISFDPEAISFEDLLYVFWRTHDPTTLNRQGADVGTQYRSVILYHDEQQKAIAEKSKRLYFGGTGASAANLLISGILDRATRVAGNHTLNAP
jgi:peptide-methionine (S)-S-oxide reductase